MSILKILFFLTMSFMMYSFSFAETPATTQEQCAATCKLRHEKILDVVHSLEKTFVKMHHLYDQHRILVYGRLWEAHALKKDSFSPRLRARGETQRQRYQYFVDLLEDNILEHRESLQAQVNQFDSVFYGLNTICAIQVVQRCVTVWQSRVEDSIQGVIKVVNQYLKEEEKVRELVVGMLEETKSEHIEYQIRFRDHLQKWYEIYYPDFVDYLYAVLDTLQHDWLEEDCCELCTLENMHLDQEPFEMQQRLERIYGNRWERKAFEDNRLDPV